MAYEGTFVECLTAAAERLRIERESVVLLWQEHQGSIWKARAYQRGGCEYGARMEQGVWRFIALDYEMMRSLLIWMAENVLKGAN